MTSITRSAWAVLVLSLTAQAGAQDLWIHSDSTSRDNKLGSVVLLELGSSASCIVCRAAPAPMDVHADLSSRTREPGFYEVVSLRRAGKINTASSPPPARFANDSVPSMANDSWRAIANPNPVPPVSRLREPSSR